MDLAIEFVKSNRPAEAAPKRRRGKAAAEPVETMGLADGRRTAEGERGDQWQKGRGGLGRGLESLFEDAAPSFESDTRIETLPCGRSEPDPGQPRKTFDDETLAELSASIAEHGLLQPIAVRPKPSGGYLIVAGERRWRASRMAGLTEVPVIVKDVTDEQAMELALVENLQREDLDPVEEAAGIRELMTRCDLTQEQAARKLGKSRSALANSLRLLSLPETVLELLKSGFITIGHAKVVLGLPTPELQEEAAQMIADNQLNVRQAEALCKKAGKARKRACGPRCCRARCRWRWKKASSRRWAAKSAWPTTTARQS